MYAIKGIPPALAGGGCQQKLVVEAGTHKIQNGKGQSVTIYATTSKHRGGCIVAECEEENAYQIYTYRSNGQMFRDRDTSADLRIVPISPKSLGWVGVYRHENKYYSHVIHSTSESLLKLCRPDRKLIAIHEFFEGDGITQS